MRGWWLMGLVSAAVAVSGCRTDGAQRAVVVDASQPKSRAAAPASPKKKARPASTDWRPKAHLVKKGDTLYSIAFNYGLDYRELAELNGIQNPSLIYIGQEIRLFPQAARAEAAARASEPPAEAATAPVPVEPPKKAPEILTKTAPKAVKLPYSEQALAQIEAMPDWSKPKLTAPVAVATPEALPAPESTGSEPGAAKAAVKAPVPVRPETPKMPEAPKPEAQKAEPQKAEPPKPVAKKAESPEAESGDAGADEEAGDDESVGWIAPTSGKVIGGFSESANRKGVDIAGKLGQPIHASASGKVVYSGSGLRGYGKLIIIKHNKTYISAYAHNDKVLVKERQQVSKGDKIAEMGNTDSEQVKLHFEIRKFGKPIDPAKLLPPIQP